MRWYVSYKGETHGPVEDAQVAAWAREGLAGDAMVREESGGQWMPIAKSPFGGLVKRGAGWGTIALVSLFVAFAGLLVFGGGGALVGGVGCFGLLALSRIVGAS